MRCSYDECNIDEGDDYCGGCLADLDEHRRLVERNRCSPVTPLETPEGQRQLKDALRLFKEVHRVHED